VRRGRSYVVEAGQHGPADTVLVVTVLGRLAGRQPVAPVEQQPVVQAQAVPADRAEREVLGVQVTRQGSFADQPFIDAGARLKELVDPQPCQNGFLGAAYGDHQVWRPARVTYEWRWTRHTAC
jgi:hypothetical protein